MDVGKKRKKRGEQTHKNGPCRHSGTENVSEGESGQVVKALSESAESRNENKGAGRSRNVTV